MKEALKKRAGVIGATLGMTAAGLAAATTPTPVNACGANQCGCSSYSGCLNGVWTTETCCSDGAGYTCSYSYSGCCC